ncbi:Monocopper oxidase-like protein SKU5 [Camellia lanceoleosa]|uniref:Monocopper oxidase-like protein SKU5 n=1 Tax=Camellia lanceoleosa TaxID=1840588 RepID=A0ACC0H7S6_9ERIC|nr:Monocopper oxidase-like protein SKU5 [Camellia lanceoleosa]
MVALASGDRWRLIFFQTILTLVVTIARSEEIFLEWHVTIDLTLKPKSVDQPVITINGMFPGPLINSTTNDNVHVNVFNDMDEPLLMTWNGIQQRKNSWQDGVSGTNCPIQPGMNWTYVFQTKDQIGTFFYFPSLNFHKAGGGFGPIRVNNRAIIAVPFPKPEAEFDLLIGDWYQHNFKTYRFRIANVGIAWSINFRIQNHQMVVVETEGSYTNQITLDSLDVHVGQSYSVLVTANQEAADYYIVASPKLSNATDNSSLVGRAVLHYDNSTTTPNGPLPKGPDPFDLDFSLNQAKSIRCRRIGPQGTVNVSNVTLSHTFIPQGSTININGVPRYTLNNVSYTTPDTPLKLADNFINGSDVYNLDEFPVNSSNPVAVDGTFVATGNHKGWLEIVFKNDLNVMDSWHLDGFGFYVVGWTAVYAYLDNPGMWNLRSQHLKNWYLGQELYVRVYDADPDPAKERPPPENLLFCGKVDPPPPPPPSPPPPPTPNPIPAPPPQTSSALAPKIAW